MDLSLGTMVIEANIKSGTMHTANFTLNQKRLLICFNTNRSGNKFLLKNNNVMSINGKDDISRIKIQLDKVRESLENKKIRYLKVKISYFFILHINKFFTVYHHF